MLLDYVRHYEYVTSSSIFNQSCKFSSLQLFDQGQSAMSKILILAFDKMELLPNVEIMEVCSKLHDFRIAQVQQF